MAFYIVGSKFGARTDKSIDVYPEMIKESAVFVGFSSHNNLTNLYLQEKESIKEYLVKKKEPQSAINSLTKYLNIEEGDLVAIKKFSTNQRKKQRLMISAIAIVKSINGQIYFHDKKFGHGIHVEFLDININKEYEMVYMRTVHKLSNTNHIKELFSDYLDQEQVNLLAFNKKQRKIELSIEKHLREISNRNILINVNHKKIQKKLFKTLVKKHGHQNVQLEVYGMDILVNSKENTIIYEIKSYDNVKQCIREALGQLLEYKWNNKNLFYSKNISLVIVGQNNLSSEEEKYMQFIRSSLNEAIDYLSVGI